MQEFIQEFKEFWDLTYSTFIKHLGDLKKISWPGTRPKFSTECLHTQNKITLLWDYCVSPGKFPKLPKVVSEYSYSLPCKEVRVFPQVSVTILSFLDLLILDK